MSFALPSVGTIVRVQSPDGEASSRAIISFFNDDRTCDIVYHADNIEESSVPQTRIQPLEKFEYEIQSGKMFSVFERKEFGNTLFKLKDLDAAVEMYRSVIRELCAQNYISVGSRVLVSNGSGEYYPGIVSGVESGAYEVLYDDEDFEDESAVAASRISMIAMQLPDTALDMGGCSKGYDPVAEVLDLQRAVYMNLARCALKKSPPQPGWAARWSSLAIAMTKYASENSRSSGTATDGLLFEKQLVDAYFLRSKAFLAASRPQLARRVSAECRVICILARVHTAYWNVPLIYHEPFCSIIESGLFRTCK
jgi:hypothetical protein